MNDVKIQNLASDCHWAMLVFTVAHEVAHIYQVETNEDYWKSHLKEAGIDAFANSVIRLVQYLLMGDDIYEASRNKTIRNQPPNPSPIHHG